MAKREVNIKLNVDAKGAVKSTDKLGKSLDGVAESTNDASKGLSKTGETGSKSLKSVSNGFKGVGLAIKAAGIGLVIAAFVALKEILEKQQPVLDFIDSAFTSIGLAVTTVSKSLKNSTSDFSALGKVMSGIGTLVLAPLKAQFYAIKGAILSLQLGWESSFLGGGDEKKIAELKESITEVGVELIKIKDDAIAAAVSIGDNIAEAATEVSNAATEIGEAVSDLDIKATLAEGKRITAMKNAAKIAEAINKGKFEAFDREAELLRQQRDDFTNSVESRQEANNKLAEVLNEQEKIMLRNASIVESAAAGELAANNTIENRVALINAQNEKEAIRADIAGRRSEQLINEIGLEKEKTEAQLASELALKESGLRQIASELELKNLRAEQGLEDPNATLEEQQAKFEELQAIKEEQFNTELEVFLEQAAIKGATEEEINAQKLLKTAKFSDSVEKIEKSRIEKIEKAEEDAAKNKENLQKLTAAGSIGVAKDVLGAVSSILDEGSAEAKAISLAQATISGFQGVQAAYTSALAIPTIGITLAPIAAAAAGVVAAKNIQKIASSKTGSKKDSGGGGGGGGFSAGSFTPISIPEGNIEAPSINTETLFSTQNLEGSDSEEVGNGRGLNQKVVVLESDITENQNRVLAVENNAQIG